MSGLSSAGETLLLNTLLAARYVSLHTSDPSDAGSGEVSGGAYARQAVTFANTGNNPTLAKNTNLVQFPIATSFWGTITFFGLWSASSAGTFYISGPITTPKAITVDDIARFVTDSLVVSAQ